jgi:hypothetical protein
MAAGNHEKRVSLAQTKKLVAFGSSLETAIAQISESFTGSFDDEDLNNPVIIRRVTETINQKFQSLMSTLNLGSLEIPRQREADADPYRRGQNPPQEYGPQGQGGQIPPRQRGRQQREFKESEPLPKRVNRSRPPPKDQLPRSVKATVINWLKGLLAKQNSIDVQIVTVPKHVETKCLWIAKDLYDRSSLNYGLFKETILNEPSFSKLFPKSKQGRSGRKKSGNAGQSRKQNWNGSEPKQNSPPHAKQRLNDSNDEVHRQNEFNSDNEEKGHKQKAKRGPETPEERFGKYMPQFILVKDYLAGLQNPGKVKPSRRNNLKANLKRALRDARKQILALAEGINLDPSSEPKEFSVAPTLRDVVFIVDRVKRSLNAFRCIQSIHKDARIHEWLITLPHQFGNTIEASLEKLKIEKNDSGYYLLADSLDDQDEEIDRKLSEEEWKDFKQSNHNLIWLQALTLSE